MTQYVCQFFKAGKSCRNLCKGPCVCEMEYEEAGNEPGYHVARKQDWEVA